MNTFLFVPDDLETTGLRIGYIEFVVFPAKLLLSTDVFRVVRYSTPALFKLLAISCKARSYLNLLSQILCTSQHLLLLPYGMIVEPSNDDRIDFVFDSSNLMRCILYPFDTAKASFNLSLFLTEYKDSPSFRKCCEPSYSNSKL